jgi:lipopolysaccharide/colanic/teichoic acid biosynthesis glycosyltransferase
MSGDRLWHKVKTGITGRAQINGFLNKNAF